MSEERTWEKIQQKTFTKWVNSHLRKRKMAIQDLKTDFSTGVDLIAFLEIISNQTLGKYEKKPKIRIQKIGNVSTALEFLKSQKIKLVNISPEDIVDENLKLILGLIWTIIQKFAIDDISEEEMSAKEALLLWCQKKTAGYKDCKVDNFTWSFQDGLALCALINKHRPDLIDYSKLSKENKAENLQLAFDVAESELGIPKLLDVEDMVDIKPDERSVITYVSQYYHVFSKYNQSEVAGRRIGKLVDMTEVMEGMKNDYNQKASNLVAWINQTTPAMEERDFDGTLEGVNEKINDFKTYKSDDKPPKAADKSNVEALFNNINMKLRANNRPLFTPAAGTSPSEIDGLWEKLGQAESDREKALNDELKRQERLAYLRQRFNLKAGKLEAWLREKEQYLNTEEEVNSLNVAETKLKNHDSFDEEYKDSRPRLDLVKSVCEEMLALQPLDAEQIKQKTEELESRWTGLAPPQASKRTDLEQKLAKEQKKEELRKQFAKMAKEYGVWNKEQTASSQDHYFGDDLETVEAFENKMNESDAATTSASNDKKAALDQVWDEMQQLGITENRYSPITNKDIENQHNNLLSELEKRKAAYQAELERQRMMEEKRKEFAAKAQEFADSTNARREAIKETAKSGEPEEASNNIKATYGEGKQETDSLSALNALQNELSSLGIRDNKYTSFTMPDLHVQNNKFAKEVQGRLAALKDEAALKQEYVSKAQAVSDWGNSTLPSLKETNFDNTLAGAKASRNDWQRFLTSDKAKKDIDRLNLDTLFAKIEQCLQENSRPAYQPASPLDPASLTALWDQLNAGVKEKDALVTAELDRQTKCHTLAKKFNSEADDLDQWAAEKEPYLTSSEEVNDLETARMKVSVLDVFNTEFSTFQPSLTDLKSQAEALSALNYHDIDAVNGRVAKLEETGNRFKDLSDAKGSALKEALAVQQTNEDLRISFANAARNYQHYLDDAEDDVNERQFGYSLEAVTEHGSVLDSSDNEINSKADGLEAECKQHSSSLAERGVTDNRHTELSMDSLSASRDKLTQAQNNRREAYAQELQRQQNNEDKRKNFAAKADSFVHDIDQHKATLTSMTGEADERIEKVHSLYQDGAPTSAQLDELKSLNEELHSLGVYDNKHTANSLSACQTKKNQFDSSVKNFLADLAEEKAFNERAAALQAEHEQATKLENMRIHYANDSSSLKLFLETASETLNEPINCSSIADAEELQKSYDDVVAETPAQQQRYDSCVTQAADLSAAGASAGVPIETLTASWNTFQADSDSRKATLSDELEKQKANEQLRVSFAEKAKELDSFNTEQTAFVNSVEGELEAQLESLRARKPTIMGGSSLVDAVSDCNNQLIAAGVRSNEHTELNFATLKAAYEELCKATKDKESLIEKEILRKNNSSVSAEQLAEFKEVFEHFDKDKSGSLGRLEFKSCLQSLGEDLSDKELDSTISSIGSNGRVPFSSFVDFMSSKAADSDSQPQILEAFKTLAGDKDFITEDEMRRALPAEKVAYLTSNMPLYKDTAGSYDYVAWASKAFA